MTFRKPLFYFFALSLFALPAFAQNETYNGHSVVAAQVLMQVSNPSPAVLQQLRLLGDADDFRTLNGALNLYLLHSKTGRVTALLNVFKNHPSVVFVEPDYIVTGTATPNDPSFSQQWALLNTSTPGADIGATGAWGFSTGSSAFVAGVVDTGLDYNHPDLAPNVWSAPSRFSVNLSWGTITCPAGSHGYNAVARTCDPMDDNAHGTHVSGTIGAAGNNGVGVTGLNWITRIMGLKFLDSTGSGSISNAIDAIEFGLQAKTIFGGSANLRVLSNSWAGSGFSQSLLNEINKAATADVLFVAAAGNNGTNNDTSPTYPASYNAANVITVAATSSTDGLASFSDFGATTVHLGAPGVNILSTLPNSSYGYYSGTSMATPHVSGAALLLLSKCALNTVALKSLILSNVDLIPSLAGMTVTGGRLNVNKAIRSCSGGSQLPPSGTASFVNLDTATSGTWKSAYGADGYNVIGDAAGYPSYVTVTPSGISSYTWAGSTTDVRATQKAISSTDRIASCWYSSGAFSLDLSFNDSNTHRVALYLLDWDNFGPRSERVDVLDANTNAVIDTRTVSGFTGGQYLVWNFSGHVIVRVTNLVTASNAVISGIFFGAASGSSQPGAAAAFVRTDTATAGTWKSAYGADGYNVIGDSSSYPAYVTATPSGMSSYTWAGSTTDLRALQKATSSSDRIASCWYSSGAFSIDLRFSDANTHQVALYLLDWDSFGPRSERVDVLDANTNAVIDTRTVSGFSGGQYLVWNFSGHVIVRVTNLNGAANAVVNGIFFGTAAGGSQQPGAAAFLRTDTTTAGTWKGTYGADGYNVIGDAASYPAYVTATPSGMSSFTWAGSTANLRALQKATSSTDRIASCWYSSGAFSIDLAFSDANTHQVGIYLLDWDSYGPRSERVDVLDANTNAVLDTRTVSSFGGGQYLVWNFSGHVIVRVTNLNGPYNAVISGIFFR